MIKLCFPNSKKEFRMQFSSLIWLRLYYRSRIKNHFRLCLSFCLIITSRCNLRLTLDIFFVWIISIHNIHSIKKYQKSLQYCFTKNPYRIWLWVPFYERHIYIGKLSGRFEIFYEQSLVPLMGGSLHPLHRINYSVKTWESLQNSFYL